MHGGLSPDLEKPKQILELERPVDVPDAGMLCDILWSDPDNSTTNDWEESSRGVSFTFKENIVKQFCEKHEIDLIARGHMVVNDGYEFFADRHLVTIFSAPNYCGYFENDGCLMKVGEDLTCSFMILKPQKDPEFKFNLIVSDEIENPKHQKIIKRYLKPKPVIKELVESKDYMKNGVAEEHQITLKTNKGTKKVNMWLKPTPIFDSNECLDNFLKDT